MKNKVLITLFILIFISFLIYFPSLSNGFTNFDDDVGITTNTAIRDFSFQSLKNTFSTFTLGMYMPLTMWCYTCLYRLAALQPFAYHLFQLLVHLCNIYLIFSVIRRLHPNQEVALISAGLFALHPMGVESVSWVAALSTPLYVCFYLLAMRSYLDFEAKKTKMDWLKVLFFFVLACLSKSAAVTLPVILLLIDFYQKKTLHIKQQVIEKGVFFVISIFFGLLTFYSRNSQGVNFNFDTKFNLFDRFLMVSHTILFYWTKLFFPVKLNLWYPFYQDNDAWSIDYYAAPILLAGIAYWIFFKAKKYRELLIFGLLFYLFTIGLSLPLVKTGAMEMRSDRYNYLPCIGLFFLVGVLYDTLKNNSSAKKSIIIANFFLLFLVGFFAFLTFERSHIWKNSIHLFSSFIEKNPREPIPYYNRGLAYFVEENFVLAEKDFTKALNLDKNYIGNIYKKGTCLMKLKRYEEAIKDFNEALLQNPNQANTYHDRAYCKLQLADFQGTIEDCNEAIRLNTTDAPSFYDRALALAAIQKNGEAIADYSKVIALKSDYTEAYINRANIYGMSGQFELALSDYDKAIGQSQRFPNAYANRGFTYLTMKRYDAAINDFSAAIRLNPKYAKAYQGRAAAYEAIGEKAKAASDLSVLTRNEKSWTQ